ncbi:MAG: hypothetical protein WHS38_09560 [Thermodesulforhabdaceae bacterium]
MKESQKPSFRAYINNLKTPGSIPKKLFTVLRNLFIRLVTFKNCCGHPGEPGC